MSALDQGVVWFAFVGVVIVARILVTRPLRRLLGPSFRRLATWGIDHLNRPEEIDPEVEEMMLIRRRQQLEGHVERLRRLLATDMGMSATRQIGNRMAYAWLLDELQRTPILLPMMVPTRSVSLTSHDSRRGSTVEILDIGWRN